MHSWIKIDKNSDFSIYNLPFGIFSESDNIKRVGVAIGEDILDLYAAFELGIFKDVNFDISVLEADYLNAFIALGKAITVNVRKHIQDELCNPN
jgi:fumarylacetoacetase